MKQKGPRHSFLNAPQFLIRIEGFPVMFTGGLSFFMNIGL